MTINFAQKSYTKLMLRMQYGSHTEVSSYINYYLSVGHIICKCEFLWMYGRIIKTAK